MRVALVNPAWDYEGSIYFGCREPHLPLERRDNDRRALVEHDRLADDRHGVRNRRMPTGSLLANATA